MVVRLFRCAWLGCCCKKDSSPDAVQVCLATILTRRHSAGALNAIADIRKHLACLAPDAVIDEWTPVRMKPVDPRAVQVHQVMRRPRIGAAEKEREHKRAARVPRCEHLPRCDHELGAI